MSYQLWFSQRAGKTPVKRIVQVESMDDDLRNAIWNTLFLHFIDDPNEYDERKQQMARDLWAFLKRPVDEAPIFKGGFQKAVRELFYQAEWFGVYDLVEFFASCETVFTVGRRGFVDELRMRRFFGSVNDALRRELAGYRLVDGLIAPVSSEEEATAIEEALNDRTLPKGAREHICQAVRLLSDRKNPDYRNSIKESISAVESLCKALTVDKKATLGTAIGKLDPKIPVHSAFRDALTKLYGWTSDAEGIRHGVLDAPSLDQADARFMLVSCCAFVNYLTAKAAT